MLRPHLPRARPSLVPRDAQPQACRCTTKSIANKSPTGSLPPAVPLAITPTFRPWTHTSDDSYIYQLSVVVATATVLSQTLLLNPSFSPYPSTSSTPSVSVHSFITSSHKDESFLAELCQCWLFIPRRDTRYEYYSGVDTSKYIMCFCSCFLQFRGGN